MKSLAMAFLLLAAPCVAGTTVAESPKREFPAKQIQGAGRPQFRNGGRRGLGVATRQQPKSGLEIVNDLDELMEATAGSYRLVGPIPLLELEIERSGNGLLARLVPPEAPFDTEFKKECQIAETIFTELTNNQVNELRRKLRRPSNIPESWPNQVLKDWQRQREELGELQEVSHWAIGADSFTYKKWLGTDDDGQLLWKDEDVIRVWVRINFRKNPIVAMVGFVDGTVQYLHRDAGESFCRGTSQEMFFLRRNGDWVARDDPHGKPLISRHRGQVILSRQIGREAFMQLAFERD